MANLLSLMTPEDREKVESRFKARMEKNEVAAENLVSSEVYIVSEFGYYFGWAGIEAIRKNEITLEEAYALLEGARKVWYTKLLEESRSRSTSVGAVLSKNGNKVYKDGMKPFMDAAKIKGTNNG